MTEYGIKADYKHDYSESSKYQPRHLATFAERGNANGVIAVQDPFWVVCGPSGDATTDGFVKIGIADGTGSWPNIGAATYIKLENGKVTSRGDLDIGAFYADVAQISVPSNPAAGARRVFVDSATGKLSVRTNAGATVSLEEVGGNGGGTVGGTGTAGTITKWAAGGADIEDSIITESGTTITVGGDLMVNTIIAGIADYDKFLVSHAGLIKFRTGAEAYSDMNGYVTTDFTTDFAAESLANLGTRTHASLSDAPADAHHNQAHALSGTDHTASGLTIGHVIAADSATTFSWQAPTTGSHVLATTGPHTGTLPWGDLNKTGSSLGDLATRAHVNLSDAPADAHHAQSHALSGADHTGDLLYTQIDDIVDIAGVGANNLLSRADHVHTDLDGSSKVTYSNLSGIPSTFTPIAHDLTSAYHTDSGLTGGHFLKTDTATTFSWQAHGLTASDVGASPTGHTHADYLNKNGSVALTADWPSGSFDISAGSFGCTNGDNKGYMGPMNAWGLHRTTAGYVQILMDAPFEIKYGTSQFFEIAVSGATYIPGALTVGNVGGSSLTLHDVNLSRTAASTATFANGDYFGMYLGTTINEFSTDTTLAGNSDNAVPTEAAVKAYVDALGSPVSGSGTQWTLPVWDTTTTIGDSMLSQDSGGTLLTVGGDVKLENDLFVSNLNAVFRVISSLTDKATAIRVYPTGTQDATSINVCNAADMNNTGMAYLMVDGAIATIGSFGAGTGTAPTTLNINDADWDAINIGDASCTVTLGDLNVTTLPAGVADYNKFLVSDGGEIKFRTGAQVASDIGAATVPLALTDLASYVQGSIIKGGATDWDTLALGTTNYVLKAGASEPSWGTIDWGELTGTQPAPVAHGASAHTGNIIPGANQNFSGYNIEDVGRVSCDFIEKAGFSTGVNVIRFDGSTNSDHILRFRTGGSTTIGIAGACYSTFGSNHWFFYSDRDYLSSCYPLRIGFSSSATEQPDPDTATDVMTMYSNGDVVINGGDLTAANFITAGNVDGVDVSEEPARISTEIDTDISTHAGLSDAHHAKYTNSEAVAAVQAADPLDLTNNLVVTGGHIYGSGGIIWIGDSTTDSGILSLGTAGVTNPTIRRDSTVAITLRSGDVKFAADIVMVGTINSYDISPITNNTEKVGTSTTDKYLIMHASSFNTGDIIFGNEFRITEVRHPDWDEDPDALNEDMWAQSKADGATPGLEFYNGRNEMIALLDEDGNFHVRGKIYEFSSIFN